MIRTYFLRMYAAELSRSRPGPRPWGTFTPYGEAVYQTALLVAAPILGIGAAAMVVLPRTIFPHGLLPDNYHGVILACFVMVPAPVAYFLVWKLVRGYKNSPESASAYGTPRDRVMGNVQFWAVLLSSLPLPFLAGALLELAR